MRTPVQKKSRPFPTLHRKLEGLLRRDERVAFAFLFGSRAVGLEREGSDVDLAVYHAHSPTLWELLRLQEELAEALGLSVQVISLNGKVRPCFLRAILEQGIVVKNAPEREAWTRGVKVLLRRREETMKKDIRRPLIDSLKEKVHLLRQVLPRLKGVDLKKALAGDLDEQARFIGLFMMTFEPTEAALRKVAALLAVEERGKPPASLVQVIEKVRGPLDLSAETVEVLHALKPLRDTLAHAYWEISAETLQKFDKAALERGLRALQAALAEHVLEQERELEGE